MKKSKLFSELDQMGRNLFISAVRNPRILTCPQGVVTYMISEEESDLGTVLQHVLGPKEIDDKIREILAITPDINLEKLTELGRTMGISIQHFEKSKPPAKPDQDVIF